MRTAGDFVAVWTDGSGADGDDWGIVAQHYLRESVFMPLLSTVIGA